jgi:cellulose biosynthesis protein BcsQ
MTQKIIAFVNQKGGVGKTTTAVNVAAQLAGKDRPVLLLDLDPQGNATSGLGIAKDQIDCPPSLGLLTINALTAADCVLIPVQAEYFALEGLGQLLNTVQRVRETVNPPLELLGVAITMYDKRTSLSEQVLAEIKTHFGAKLFKTTIPRNVRLAEAPSYGQTIFEHDKWSRGAWAYKALAKEVNARVEGKTHA